MWPFHRHKWKNETSRDRICLTCGRMESYLPWLGYGKGAMV